MILFVEQVDQAGDAHHDPDPLTGPLGQEGSQPVVVEVVRNHGGQSAGRQELGTGQEVPAVHFVPPGEKIAHGELGQGQDGLALHGGVGLELLPRAFQHVQVDHGGGAEAAALDQDRFLAEDFARLEHLFVRAEHGDATQSQLHQLQGHQPVVDAPELDAAEPDEIDLHPVGTQPVEQALHQFLGLVVLEEGAVEQVHPHDPECLLLQRRLDVEQTHVQDHLARFVVWMRLELDAHPSVALIAPAEAPRHDRVGEGEERGVVAPPLAQPVDVEGVLVVQHRLQPGFGDVAVDLAVDGVADGHVVGGDRLGDRARRPADAEEPAGHLLTGTDFGHRPVPARIQVDAQGLLMGVDRLPDAQSVCHHPPLPSVWTGYGVGSAMGRLSTSPVVTDEIPPKATAV